MQAISDILKDWVGWLLITETVNRNSFILFLRTSIFGKSQGIKLQNLFLQLSGPSYENTEFWCLDSLVATNKFVPTTWTFPSYISKVSIFTGLSLMRLFLHLGKVETAFHDYLIYLKNTRKILEIGGWLKIFSKYTEICVRCLLPEFTCNFRENEEERPTRVPIEFCSRHWIARWRRPRKKFHKIVAKKWNQRINRIIELSMVNFNTQVGFPTLRHNEEPVAL